MADGAVQAILRASAPGHLDAVADSLQKLAPKACANVLPAIKKEQALFQCLESQPSPNHPLAAPLSTKLKQYQQNNFADKTGVTSRVAMTTAENETRLVVHTYAEKMDAPNRHSGYWRATWTIDNNATTADSAQLSGRIQVHSYAHEEGNAQVKVDQDFSQQTVAASKGTTLVQAIMKQITEWESQVLALLASMNEGGTGDHLKSIRRVLPITKTKMKWDVVAQRSVKTLKKTAPQAKSKVSYGS
jgi:capping protein (actin filament) muscle Z-line, alpha